MLHFLPTLPSCTSSIEEGKNLENEEEKIGKNVYYFPVCLPATPLLTILKMESTNENGKRKKVSKGVMLTCKPGSIDDHAITSTNGNVEKNVGKGVLLTCIPGPIVAHASIVLESIKSETKGG